MNSATTRLPSRPMSNSMMSARACSTMLAAISQTASSKSIFQSSAAASPSRPQNRSIVSCTASRRAVGSGTMSVALIGLVDSARSPAPRMSFMPPTPSGFCSFHPSYPAVLDAYVLRYYQRTMRHSIVSVNPGNQRRSPAGDRQPLHATPVGEDRLSTLIEALADAVLTLDAAGLIVHANPTAVQLLGAPNKHLRGRSLEDLVRHELPGALGRTLSSLASGQSNRRMEVDVAVGCDFTPAEISMTRLPPAAGPEAFIVVLQLIRESPL